MHKDEQSAGTSKVRLMKKRVVRCFKLVSLFTSVLLLETKKNLHKATIEIVQFPERECAGL